MRWFIWWSRPGCKTTSEGPFDSREAADAVAAQAVIPMPEFTYEIRPEAR